MLRRVKKDELAFLPNKYEKYIYVGLTKVQ